MVVGVRLFASLTPLKGTLGRFVLRVVVCAATELTFVSSHLTLLLSSYKKNPIFRGFFCMADGVRFELTNSAKSRRFSRPVHSTALPSVRNPCILSDLTGKIKGLCESFFVFIFVFVSIR